MLIVVFRHGNTFAPGEPVVCAGRQDGLPLVPSGVQQAQRAAGALVAAGLRLTRVWASPRLRAQQFAATLVRAGAPGAHGGVATDPRLDEIDYGPWTGRTRAELQQSGAAAAVHAWDGCGAWPTDAGFGGSEGAVRAQLQAWLDDVANDEHAGRDQAAVAVSHGGTMRYLPTLVSGAWPQRGWPGPHRVRCGHATALRLVAGRLELLGGNLDPEALARTLRAARGPGGVRQIALDAAAVVPGHAARLS